MMLYDIGIIGAGPAGLTAAIYAARNGKNVIVFEKSCPGGKITESPNVENIPGFKNISGLDFGENLYEQAIEAGATVEFAEIESIIENKFTHTLVSDNSTYEALALIIATGSENRKLNVPGEEALIGSGVHFCSTCDGNFYKGKDVVVIGGGNTAATEALELANICNTVTIIQNLDTLTCEKILSDRLNEYKNIFYMFGTVVTGFQKRSEKIIVKAAMADDSSAHFIVPTDGVFEAIGLTPQTSLFKDIIPLDEKGFIEILPFDLKPSGKTNIFAAGDCTSGPVKQVVTACAQGAAAALEACKYLDNSKTLLGETTYGA